MSDKAYLENLRKKHNITPNKTKLDEEELSFADTVRLMGAGITMGFGDEIEAGILSILPSGKSYAEELK